MSFLTSNIVFERVVDKSNCNPLATKVNRGNLAAEMTFLQNDFQKPAMFHGMSLP